MLKVIQNSINLRQRSLLGSLPTCSLFLPEMLLEEVDADGLLVVVGEDAAAVSLDHARLAHSPVPHDHHLRRQSHTFASEPTRCLRFG